eukprot:TRINITY_DN25578_c0_g1_i1.p1 TRINITY_DN25578_c0_g1~~TRINITY_DN25578_c0_g1_i1.p1  ORF type:complete len:410 (+),score=81.02 TRINITY_DN25578_c0_g1_i1:65-1294(+)
MSFRVAHFNILGKHMAGTMWFHYARDFLPSQFSSPSHWDWSRAACYPRHLSWNSHDGRSRFHRFQVLLAEIRALKAEVICLVELDCFTEFQQVLGLDGYDAVFQARPGKQDGCGIFWRRDLFEAAGPCRSLTYASPADDRIALAQMLRHSASQQCLLVVSTHLHWDQQTGHQASEAEELLALIDEMSLLETSQHGAGGVKPAVVVCGDLNALPSSPAYKIMSKSLRDAAVPAVQQKEGGHGYVDGSFTTLKPDVYYLARPKQSQRDRTAQDEWHWQEGRKEVIDYIFFDPQSLVLEKPAATPCLPSTSREEPGASEEAPPAKRARTAGRNNHKTTLYGFWSGGSAFPASPVPDFRENVHNLAWRPPRAHGELLLGIPNRLHGSDHLPVVCRLRLRGAESCREKVTLKGG